MAIRSQLTQLEGQQVNDLKKLHFIALELKNRGISIRSVQMQLLKTLAVVE